MAQKHVEIEAMLMQLHQRAQTRQMDQDHASPSYVEETRHYPALICTLVESCLPQHLANST
jgi:hypothetical protein